MYLLTQIDVLNMNRLERQKQLDYFQDLACNIDYIVEPILSDLINSNINILESKILYSEY